MVKAAQTTARMDLANKALCYALRFPPKGVKKTSLTKIVKEKLVVKTDGSVPTEGAVSQAAAAYKLVKAKRGRRSGWRKN